MSQWSARGGQKTSRPPSRETRLDRGTKRLLRFLPCVSRLSELGRSEAVHQYADSPCELTADPPLCLRRSNSKKPSKQITLLTSQASQITLLTWEKAQEKAHTEPQ